METTEALGYLKGLLDGLDLDDDKKETKMFKAIIDVLDSMNEDVDDLCEELDIIEEQLDEIDDDLASLEETVYDDCCDGCDGCCGDDDFDEEMVTFEIECPACGAAFEVDESTVMEGEVECPTCGELLNFEIEYDEEPETEE